MKDELIVQEFVREFLADPDSPQGVSPEDAEATALSLIAKGLLRPGVNAEGRVALHAPEEVVNAMPPEAWEAWAKGDTVARVDAPRRRWWLLGLKW